MRNGENLLLGLATSKLHKPPSMPGVPDRNMPSEPCPLSEREQDILLMISLGLSNKYIARRMDISVRTVEIHRANLRNKLGTGTVNRLEAMVAVIMHSSSQRVAELLEIDIDTVENKRSTLRRLLN